MRANSPNRFSTRIASVCLIEEPSLSIRHQAESLGKHSLQRRRRYPLRPPLASTIQLSESHSTPLALLLSNPLLHRLQPASRSLANRPSTLRNSSFDKTTPATALPCRDSCCS